MNQERPSGKPLSSGMGAVTERELVERLRLLADADLRELARDIPIMGLTIDGGELKRWADAMDEAADTITRLLEDNERLRKALNGSVVLIDDLLQIYAEELCDADRVRTAKRRITENGGTLAYIADVQQANRAALSSGQEVR